MNRTLAFAYTYAEFVASLVGILPVTAVSAFVHRNDEVPRYPGRWVRKLGKTASDLTPLWHFKIEGTPPADIDRRGYVVVANHESQADPFLLSHLPWDMRWVAKAELFRIPVAGWLLALGGDIPIHRGDRTSAHAMMDECKRTIENGLSVMIFPEGTRSKDGSILPFKAGAFQLAMETGAKVLPVALAGTRRCRPKGSIGFGEARAIAKVLPPIDPAEHGGLESLRDATRAAIVANVHELERRLGFSPVPPHPQDELAQYLVNAAE